MKKQFLAITALLLILAVLTGCGAQKNASAVYRTNGQYESAEIAYSMSTEEAYDTSAPASKRAGTGNASLPLPENRKWIITVSMSTEVSDMDEALSAVGARISALNGYIESQSINNGSSANKRRSASLTIRIPAAQVDDFVEEVGEFTNLTSSSRYVQDITLSYTDTEGRINSLKAEEARLVELMAKAEKMSDLLEIEARLTDVRYELESYSSTLRLYDNQVNYATVDLYIKEVVQYTPTEKIGFFQRITDGLAESIVDLGQTVTDFAAWLIIDLPYLIVIGLVAWGAYAIIRKKIRKAKAKKAQAAAKAEEK